MPASFNSRREHILKTAPQTLSLGRHEGPSGIDAVFIGLSDPFYLPVALGAERVHNIALTRQFHRLLKVCSMCQFGTQNIRPSGEFVMKSKRKLAAAAVIAVLFAAAPANAQAGNDVKCLLASNLFAKAAKDPKARTAAEASKLYYLGRIHVRLNAAQLKAEMLAQQKTITPKDAGAIMNACARQMESGIKMVQAVTQQIAPKRK